MLALKLPLLGRRHWAILHSLLSIETPSSLTKSISSSLRLRSMAVKPPVAKKVKHVMERFGDSRSDDYYWLRDDSRSNPEVIAYLEEENKYTESVMADTKSFENLLFDEIKARIKEDDTSAPRRKGKYYYYTRTLQGKEYRQYCRRLASNHESPPSIHDTISDDVPEEVLLDENINSQNHKFYSIGSFNVSPNHEMIAYAEDVDGNEIYTVHIIDAATKSFIGSPLKSLTSYVEWAGNEALLYVTMDETLRPDKVWLHRIKTDQKNDACLYQEIDDTFSIDLKTSESEKFLFIGSESKTTRSIFYVDVNAPDAFHVLTPRVVGVDTNVCHRGDHFFITRRSEECFNSELLVSPVDDISRTSVLIPHRESVKIQDVQIFADNIAVCERENGLPKITTYSLPPVGDPVTSLDNGRVVEYADPVYSVELLVSEFGSSILRFEYSSLRMPTLVYHYDMNTGEFSLKKTEPVLGWFDPNNYTVERKWAKASDGTEIPLSIVYRTDLVKLDGSDPLFLYGYGSYEICIEPSFKSSLLSLLDRGIVYAIAHIRGGGEMGRRWYESGKYLNKKNTFTDFIECAEHLIDTRYTSKGKLCIEGRSAGGLLIGAVLNMRPDLFHAAVAGVPFVDVLTTMLDPTIPLTTSEWEEWGDPRKEDFYWYMKSYSPVDNVVPQNYPNLLVTAGLHDPRVMYSEPAKFVAKMRDLKTDHNLLLFKCELGCGHFSKSGRFEKLQEDAFRYAFLLKVLDMVHD